jgi:hypothetical protein
VSSAQALSFFFAEAHQLRPLCSPSLKLISSGPSVLLR